MLTPASYITTPGGWGQGAGVWDRAEVEGFLHAQFQNGPVAVHGVNGVQLQDVIQVCIDHERALQSADKSRERALVITKLEEALLWDRRRAEQSSTRENAARAAGGSR